MEGPASRPPGKDRRWGKAWSPEQISERLRVDFPDDASMQISHEAIYQALYVQGRGASSRPVCGPDGRCVSPEPAAAVAGRGFVTEEILISQRPAEAEDRAVPGHWEGDLIIGLDSSAIGTLVARSARVTMLLHLPRCPATVTPERRTVPRLPAVARRPCATRSPRRSRPCLSNCADRSPGMKALVGAGAAVIGEAMQGQGPPLRVPLV